MQDILQYYKGSERYNCAQTILKGFQQKYNISQQTIDDARANGAGRAEGGLCGALHAAKTLLTDENKKQQLEQNFSKTAGSIHCKTIRKLNLIPCASCIQTAANFLQHIDS